MKFTYIGNQENKEVKVAGSYANGAYVTANAAYGQANTATTNAATADSKAVTAGTYANSAYTQANTATTNASTADSKAVSAGTYANGAFTQANSAYNLANTLLGGGSSFITNGTSNVYFSSANGNIIANVGGNTITTVTSAGIQVNGGDVTGISNLYANNIVSNNTISVSGSGGTLSGANLIIANNIISNVGVVIAGTNVIPFIQSSFTQANTATTNASTADSKAVSAGTYANGAFIQANAAYNLANTLIGGSGNASFIYNGTSNVYFSSANGNIIANVGGNTIATVTNTGIELTNGFISGVNNIYANNIVSNSTISVSGAGGTLSGANLIIANNIISNVGVVIAGTNVIPSIQSSFIQANAAFDKANTGVANTANTATTANVAINARITIVNTGIYYPIVTDTTITGSDTFHYSSNDFLMYAANNTFRATGNIWAGQFITVGSNIPVVNSTGHWVGQTLTAIDGTARTTANNALPKAGGVVTGNLMLSSAATMRIQNTATTTSNNTGALIIDGGLAVKGNTWISGVFTVDGDFQVGNQNTSGNVYNTGTVTFIQPTLFTSNAATTSNTTGAIIVTGGIGVKGNVHSGSIRITGSSANNITFDQGTTQIGSSSILAQDITATGNLIVSGAGGDISNANTVFANVVSLTTAAIVAGLNVVPYLQSSFAQANSVYLPSVTRLNVTNSGASAYLISSYTGNNPTIYVTAGETIAFNLNVTGHPFMIRVSNGGTNYNTGLTHVDTNGTVTTDSAAQGQISGTLYWSVPFDLAGNNYVYQCSVHSGMVGTISIGQPSAILLSTTNSAFIQANAAFAAANAGGAGTDQLARNTANASFIQANAAFAAANAGGAGTDQLARDRANAAFIQANAAFSQANTGAGGASGSSVISVDTFTGNGSQNNFTLSNSTTANNIIVNIDGVLQLKSAYTVSSNTITFTGTPANNAVIEVTTLVGTNLSYFNRTYTGDNTTTSFAVTSGVTNASIIVTENGIIQEPVVDYYVNGANVVFTTPPSSTVKIGIRELASTANTGSGAEVKPLVLGTAQASTSGTSIDFTGIPNWVKRITVMFNFVSTNGTSNYQIQLGTSSGIETSGYAGTFFVSEATAVGSANFSTGFLVDDTTLATDVRTGSATFVLFSTNLWVGTGIFGLTNKGRYSSFTGTKTTASTLDRIRVTTVNGTDTFDAGSINIMYE